MSNTILRTLPQELRERVVYLNIQMNVVAYYLLSSGRWLDVCGLKQNSLARPGFLLLYFTVSNYGSRQKFHGIYLHFKISLKTITLSIDF